MSERPIYAVLGATGNTGGATASALLDRGERVRVVVRSEAKGEPWQVRGAEVAVATLDDADALGRAFEGSAGVYGLVPPQIGAPDPLAATEAVAQVIGSAAETAGVPLVLLSSVGAQHAEGTGPIAGLHRAEQALSDLEVPVTFVRAAYFLENWLMVMPAVQQDGVLPTFVAPDAPLSMVAVRDIGAAAADALLDPPTASEPRVVELASARDWTPAEVAAAFGAALGRAVAPAPAPPEQAQPTFEGMGLPANFAALYAEMYRGIEAGLVAWSGSPTRGETELDAWAKAAVANA